MKRLLTVAVIYVVGVISGLVYQNTTSGARERARTAALESEMKVKSEKLDKCTDILIEKFRISTTEKEPPTVK